MVTYKSGFDLFQGIDSFSKPVVVIPKQFAAEAPDDEITALAARQLAQITDQWRVVLALLPVVLGVAMLGIPAASTQPTLFVGAALALWAISLILQYRALKQFDISLDRAAIELTGEREPYVKAVQRAAHTVPMVPRFPWWYKPLPMSARVVAIEGAFNRFPVKNAVH